MKNKRIVDLSRRTEFKNSELRNRSMDLISISSQNLRSKKISNLLLNSLIIPSKTNNGKLAKIRNRCVITGRAGSTYKSLRMSRISIKKFISERYLSGYFKDSW